METAKTIGFKKHLPNIMSFIRIFGTLGLPFFVLGGGWEKQVTLPLIDKTYPNVPLTWVIVYLFLVFTDKADGTLARKLNAESEFGATLDAIGDTLILVMGAATVFVRFVRDSLSDLAFWLYVSAIIFCVVNKVLVLWLAQKYHGKGNMLHSIPQKAFAIGCYLGVAYWAFTRTVQPWSIALLVAVNIYATIDEVVYNVRSVEYNVDFKGHGLEKYELREK